jgi:hypothetical protein
METLVESGFLVAQSNARAIPGNGMWGNPDSQRSVLALIDHLRSAEHVRHVDAIAISAGNLTLLDLILRGTVFEHVVMLAPVTSLGSLYRCPAGVNRVRQISRAFGFSPAGGCPGDPEHDPEYRRAVSGNDPSVVEPFTPAQVRLLRAMHWLAVYEEQDPKVPPTENILAWKKKLEERHIEFAARVIPGAQTHAGPKLITENISGLLAFLLH